MKGGETQTNLLQLEKMRNVVEDADDHDACARHLCSPKRQTDQRILRQEIMSVRDLWPALFKSNKTEADDCST